MGVPQGSILGPLLFTINSLVNMIFHLCDGVKTLMYADDPVLYLHVKDLEQTHSVFKKCQNHSRFILNKQKSVTMFFQNEHNVFSQVSTLMEDS